MAVMGGSVARRYARALFGIGVDAGKFEALGDELGELATLWNESDELRQALENPVFKPAEKRAVLERILPQVAPTPEVQRFVLLLLDRRRIVLLPAIARAYRDLTDAHVGRVRAEVISAEMLTPATLDRVRRSLEQRTGKKVIINSTVDPDLIGGVVARVGDLVLDGSVRTQLEDLRREVAIQAVVLAEAIVRAQLGAQDQQRLIDSFVGDVAGNGAHAAAPPAPASSGPSGAGAAPRSEI